MRSQLPLRLWAAVSCAVLCSVPCLNAHANPLGLTEFRSIDGTGNNQLNPTLGSTFTPLIRSVPADYADGISQPAGADRPSARVISNLVCSQSTSIPNPIGVSDFFWQWGQFVDHDISQTKPQNPPLPFNVAVPLGDPYFDPNSVGNQWIYLQRSRATTASGVREQINQITAFLDGSGVYGSDSVRENAMRTLDGTGRLKTTAGDLPGFNTARLLNDPANGDTTYYLCGDSRANEQPALLAMHTLFVREHNYQAALLAQQDPSMSGEEIFQCARAIVCAEIQTITYRDWLPLLLGTGALPPWSGYDPNVDPSVDNLFSTAALRLGHTMVSSYLLRLDSNLIPIPTGHLALMDCFFPHGDIYDTYGIDAVFRGLAFQRAQAIDPYIIDDLRNFLFGVPGSGGLDLVSINIQRGRDHGLPSYNATRQAYGFSAATTFADVTQNPQIQLRLATAYSTVDDIDLFVGALSEDPLPGEMVGPLLHSILSSQFLRLRDGDRFWYQNYLPDSMLQVLSQETLADIIRRNTSIGPELPDDVFMVSGTVSVNAPLPPAVAPLRLGAAFPNPASREAAAVVLIPLDTSPRVHAAVFDAQGRRVRSVMDASLPGGAHTLRWDLRDESGGRVSAGVYFIRVWTSNYAMTRRLIVLKS